MLAIQPPFIFNYFSKNSSNYNFLLSSSRKPKIITSTPKVHKSFYLSWEDALWHLLSVYKIKQGSTILVPEFFCGNVIENMEKHGLKIEYYPVDRLLTTNIQQFKKILKKTKPNILIVFHPVGIDNKLIELASQWINLLPEKSLLIEDCVHKIIRKSEIKFLNDRHFLIDSLRKVVPIQGSRVFSSVKIPPISTFQNLQTFPYRFAVLYFWICMELNLLLAYYSNNLGLAKYFNLKAEKLMLQGYSIIGIAKFPSSGNIFMNLLTDRINIDEIEKKKQNQADKYLNILNKLINSKYFWIPEIKKSNLKKLRGFPLIIDKKIANKFLEFLRTNGLILRFELNDSKWSEDQKIIYLPMGLHINDKDVEYVTKLIHKFEQNFLNFGKNVVNMR